MNGNLSRIPSNRIALLFAASAALVMPVVLFEYAGFQVSLTLILAPLAGLCLFLAPALLRNLFFACLAAGAASIAAASVAFGTFHMRYVLSLLLMMTPPLYFYLGWYVCARYASSSVVVSILAVVSTIFVSVLALQAIITGTQIRAELGVLNLTLFGWPIYGSYGVLSLAGLFVLQLFVIAAAFLGASSRGAIWFFAWGFAAAVFLLTGSNARGPQLALPYLAVVLGLIAAVRKPVRARAAILVLVGVVSVIYSSARMAAELRIVETAKQLSESSQTRPSSPEEPAPDRKALNLESLSTGRESLLEDSLTEIKASPFFGNGFASFGRIDRRVGERSVQSGNRTTHVQYLTALWKGGVLFFVPYMALLGAFWWRAVRGAPPPRGDDVMVVGAGLVFLFAILAATWDILLVPSAGALGFFLLGAGSASGQQAAG